jgi:antitoxin FitA
MPTIHVNDIPEDTYAIIRRRAAERGQSLRAYALALLQADARRPSMAEWLAEAERLEPHLELSGATAVRQVLAER